MAETVDIEVTVNKGPCERISLVGMVVEAEVTVTMLSSLEVNLKLPIIDLEVSE